MVVRGISGDKSAGDSFEDPKDKDDDRDKDDNDDNDEEDDDDEDECMPHSTCL